MAEPLIAPAPVSVQPAAPHGGMFRALRVRNYRIWATGALVSNIGAWMQRIAQDWLVLTVLTHHNGAAVGFVTALQFGPQMLLLPWTGRVADQYDRRRVLFATQTAQGLLALGLGLLTILGVARPWQVYLFALLLGCVTAFDAPVRQTFVTDIVDEAHLANAVALNSTSFNASRLIGPAVAGLVIAAVGLGGAFLLNAASFLAVLGALSAMRVAELRPRLHRTTKGGGIGEAFGYLTRQGDLKALLVMLAVFGSFALNFPVFISTMAASVFHLDARGYGLLNSAMAVGSVTGTLLAARRERPSMRLIATGAAVFGISYAIAALMPDPLLFAALLVVVGAASQTVTTSTMSLVQMTVAPAMRGRVTAVMLTTALGGQAFGAPLMGWIANAAGPRFAICVGAFAGLVVAAIGFRSAGAGTAEAD